MSMKRKIFITLILMLLVGTSISFGVGYSKQITAYFYNIQVLLDGKVLNLSNEPLIYEGRTYIPLRDVSENLGFEVTWEDSSKTVFLKSKTLSNDTLSNSSNINSLNNISNNNMLNTNISNSDMKKRQQDNISKGDVKKRGLDNISNSNRATYDLEDDLNEKYDEYTEGDEDLEFKYTLTEYSSYIKIEMDGDNFTIDSSEWEDRDEDEFEDFIEEIAKDVADELDKDIKIYVYDEDDEKVAEYFYDESKDEFSVE